MLRIEDIDAGRCRPEFEAAILEDLAWLGLQWVTPVRRQSDHMQAYRAALETLIARGLVYRCFKTRRDILDEIARAPHLTPAGPEGPAYVGAPLAAREERSLLAEGAPFAWRLSMAAAREALGEVFAALHVCEQPLDAWRDEGVVTRRAEADAFGDVVLARKDSGTSYHLASLWDDALQGVTHVIRGEDLRPAADLHVLLQALLDLPQPVYRHHRLITGPGGERLAKRDKAQTLAALRDEGLAPADIRQRVGL